MADHKAAKEMADGYATVIADSSHNGKRVANLAAAYRELRKLANVATTETFNENDDYIAETALNTLKKILEE